MKPSIATRSSRCSRSYQRLKSASLAGSISIDVSNMPFPASGIFLFSSYSASLSPFMIRRGASAVFGRCYASNLGSKVCDRAHHRVADAGIVQRVAGAFDDADFGILPPRGKRLRGRGRAEQIVAALHDDAGNPGKLLRLIEQLVRPHEAVVLEIMRFHERRCRHRAIAVQRSGIEPRARRGVLRESALGVMPGSRDRSMHSCIRVENAAPVGLHRLRTFLLGQQAEKILAQAGIETRQRLAKRGLDLLA